jgi:hypothetical protein
VARLRLTGLAAAPASVILKLFGGVNGAAFDAGDNADYGRPGWRFATEWAGLELLDACDYEGGRPRVAPAFFGGDRERGIFLMEDAGEGQSLADVLLGDNPKRAEAALLAYSRALGRMHALSAGRQDDYDAIVDRLPPQRRPLWHARIRRDIERCPKSATARVQWSPGMVDDVRIVSAAMLRPGPLKPSLTATPARTTTGWWAVRWSSSTSNAVATATLFWTASTLALLPDLLVREPPP